MTELEKKIKKYAQEYYSGESSITDAEFDSLVEQLRKENPNSEVLTTGWGSIETGDTKKHPYHKIEGIDKIREIENLPNTLSRYIVSDKLDGSSVVAYFKNDIFQYALTRGNGIEGRDVSAKVKHLIPKDVGDESGNDFTGYIRYEAVVANQIFDNLENTNYTSARNLASGELNRKDNKPSTLLSLIAVVVYNAKTNTLIDPYNARHDFTHCNIEFVNCQSVDSKDKILDFKRTKDYLTDGLVIWVNDKKIAYKFDDQREKTVVNSIEWITHTSGRTVPVIHYQPTQLGDCITTKCSGKSFQLLWENRILPGDEIEIVRSGDVIPNWVIKPSPRPEFPQWEDYAIQLGLDSRDYEKNGAHIFRKTVDNFDVKVIEKIIFKFAPKSYSKEMFETLIKDFGNTLEQFFAHENYNNWTRKTPAFNKLQSEVISVLNNHTIPLQYLLESIIDGYGNRVGDKVEPALENECEFADLAIAINQVAPLNVQKSFETVKQRIQNLMSETDFVWEITKMKECENSGKPTVCITGKLDGYTKKEFDEIVEKKGYAQVDSVNKDTNLLIANSAGSSKYQKAQKLGIKIVSQDEFLQI